MPQPTTRSIVAFGRVWDCPRHINPLPDGWQVRFARQNEAYHSKCFGLSQHCSPDDALDAAKKHLEEKQREYLRTEQLNTHKVELPVITFSVRRKKPSLQGAVTLYSGKKRKIVTEHVGTPRTLTQERVDTAVKKLLGTWFWVVKMKAELGIDVVKTLPVPVHCDSYLPDDFELPHYDVNELRAKFGH